MAALWSWLMQRLEEISAKSSLASAIRYTLGHWEGLTVFLVDGRVEVDNNTVERGIRPIPLGRKNALFAGSHRGGERWAVLASLINSALCRMRHRAVLTREARIAQACAPRGEPANNALRLPRAIGQSCVPPR